MVFNPALPEIATVTSEALQLKIRQLLPSQDGFGADLAAQNVIVPIVDLTAAAEGSEVRESLQTAIAFGSATEFDVANTTTAIANTAGFYRVIGVSSALSTVGAFCEIVMGDGSSEKTLWIHNATSSGSSNMYATESVDLVFFLRAGDTLSIRTNNSEAKLGGSIRQIADSSGTLVQPSGFTPS
jgi:hypothetical protein